MSETCFIDVVFGVAKPCSKQPARATANTDAVLVSALVEAQRGDEFAKLSLTDGGLVRSLLLHGLPARIAQAMSPPDVAAWDAKKDSRKRKNKNSGQDGVSES